MPFDLRPLFQAFLSLWTLLFQLEHLNGSLLELIHSYVGLHVAFGIFFLAGLSEAYGTRAVMLFLNRVGRRPFFLNLLITSILFVFGAVIWAFSIREMSALFFGNPQPLSHAIQAVGLAYLPLLFAFLAFVPYLGPGLLILLQVVSLILAIFSISIGLDVTLGEAAVMTIGGWIILQLVRWLTTRPTTALSRWLLRVISGRDVHYQLRDIVPPMPLGLSDQTSTSPEEAP